MLLVDLDLDVHYHDYERLVRDTALQTQRCFTVRDLPIEKSGA